MTYWLSIERTRLKRSHTSVHIDENCAKGAVVAELPGEFAPFIQPCARCALRAWKMRSPAPRELFAWHKAARDALFGSGEGTG